MVEHASRETGPPRDRASELSQELREETAGAGCFASEIARPSQKRVTEWPAGRKSGTRSLARSVICVAAVAGPRPSSHGVWASRRAACLRSNGGIGSFTAEQFLSILKLFNVPVSHFVAAEKGFDAELQNALARLARGTKGSDVLETNPLTGDVRARLLALAGRGTAMSRRHVLYLDIVSRGLPFLPQVPVTPSTNSTGDWSGSTSRSSTWWTLVVSALKRLHANDVSDVRAMVDAGRVDHARRVERFRLAVDVFICDARADDLPRYVGNLHRVEREHLGVPGSDIELPDWVG